MSDSSRWERLQDLYEEAATLSPVDRAGLVAQVHADDPALARELDAMLAQAGGAPHLLDATAAQVAAHLLETEASTKLPDRIGAYRFVRLLGEGGMGVVYLVERDDVGGLAALKLLRDGWLSPARRARFRVEQRTLAQLRHPGIAQLYDAGSLSDGTPWFAMEYVEGSPITTHAVAHRLTVARRLGLIRSVAEAVQYAHRHAVIHRDIKPSNVLVTTAGEIKLLDFGIAKQLDDSADAERTATGLRMLTPAYAAPEQHAGGPTGVHTDVYSLGVLMYEVLTGRRPTADLASPLRPSDAVRGKTAPTGRAAWSELDMIVSTATHSDPARRYPTVEALVRDLDRYARGQPLEARPDSLRYRAGRFMRRNARAVATASVIGAAVIGLSGFYAVQLARARTTAVAEAARTARIQQFMMALFEGGEAEAGPADSVRVRDLIDRGTREAAALDNEPAVQAELHATLGALQLQMGNLDQADSLLSRALATRQRILGRDHADVATVLTSVGELRVAQARLDDAERAARQAIAMSERRLPGADLRVISAHALLGRVMQERARWPEAIAAEEIVLRRLEAGGSQGLEYPAALLELASSHFYSGNLDVSDSLSRAALARFRSLRGDNYPRVSDALINLGAAEFERGRYADAERYYRDALRRTSAWYGDAHPATASALTMLGRALNYQSHDSAATDALERAVAIQVRTHGPDHPTVASALNDLALIDLRNERLDAADRRWYRVDSIYRRVHGESHWLVGIAASNLATVRMARKDFAGAETLYRRAVRLFEASQGARHLNSGIAHIKLGRALLRQQRWRDAARESRAGYEVLIALPEAPKGFLDAARTDLAAAYDKLGDKARAAEFATGN